MPCDECSKRYSHLRKVLYNFRDRRPIPTVAFQCSRRVVHYKVERRVVIRLVLPAEEVHHTVGDRAAQGAHREKT
jgi:hypothetical protein